MGVCFCRGSRQCFLRNEVGQQRTVGSQYRGREITNPLRQIDSTLDCLSDRLRSEPDMRGTPFAPTDEKTSRRLRTGRLRNELGAAEAVGVSSAFELIQLILLHLSQHLINRQPRIPMSPLAVTQGYETDHVPGSGLKPRAKRTADDGHLAANEQSKTGSSSGGLPSPGSNPARHLHSNPNC